MRRQLYRAAKRTDPTCAEMIPTKAKRRHADASFAEVSERDGHRSPSQHSRRPASVTPRRRPSESLLRD